MAQKKVILQDGQNDLMPKTLASVVFTEDGTSVETALKNLGSGGGSSGGGTGNVKVTNASGLYKDNYYAFKPSANGSVEGTFSTIPGANAGRSGLMSSGLYTKLYNIKEEREIPTKLDTLTSASEEIDIFNTIFELISGEESNEPSFSDEIKFSLGLYFISFLNNFLFALTKDLSRVSISTSIEPPSSSGSDNPQSGSIEITYVLSGKLRSVTLTAKLNISGDSQTYDFSAKVEESGDDTYYLPANIFDLTESSTAKDVFEMFGGAEEFKKLWTYVPGRKFYIPYSTGNKNSFASYIPASVRTILSLMYQLDIVAVVPIGILSLDYEIRALTVIFIAGSWDLHAIRKETIYPSGYSLNPEVYSLTSSSDTDTISTAVGGESGLKAIIQAVKDGNRLVIRGTLDNLAGTTINQDVQCSLYGEADNGDMSLQLFGKGYGLWGTLGGILGIIYTKSSNTFSCSVVKD